ncbi:MAG TPA: vanadium-dependent haloperoxidase [Candidatus Nanopelagicales bacterium]
MSSRQSAVVRATALAVTAAVTLALSGAPARATSPAHGRASNGEVVLQWNEWAGEGAKAACLAPADNPLHESRAYAMMHVAVHDALNAIHRRYESYVYGVRAPRRASAEAAVAAAARGVLGPTFLATPAPFPPACGQAGQAFVEARYRDALAAIPEGPAKAAGLEVGTAAAAAVLQLRSSDGSGAPLVDPGFPQGTQPGQWRFTPDAPLAFGPSWGTVAPFALTSSDQFLPPPPPDVTGARYARDVWDVKRLGGDGITTPSARTPDQTQVALFWLESSPLAWNRIARSVIRTRKVDAWETARMFALLNMAMADGYIASFASKYRYRFWRPVTAIREADADGNPLTQGDPTWTPLVTNPPIPDYESAHAVEGAAAAAVLRQVLGTDRVTFSTCSLTLPAGQRCSDPDPVLRSFTTLSQAARENGRSRVLVGFHFRTAVHRGIQRGTAIGDWAVSTQLRRAR